MKKITILLIILAFVTGISSSAFALSPMGPPKARLEPHQWSFGLDYEHSEMDIETTSNLRTETIDGVEVPADGPKSKYEIDGLTSNMVYVNAGYGLSGTWDVYAQVGLSDAQADITEVQAGGVTGDKYKNFDSSYGLAWGLGTRTTLAKDGDIIWGGLLQVGWAKPDSSDLTCVGDPYFKGDAEINYWEIQLAVGPTFESDYYRIYGGPFLHFVYGDVDLKGTATYPEPDPAVVTVKSSKNIDNNVNIGGYVGTQLYLTENSSMYAECQFTSDAFGIGVGIAWKF
jgi:hypothetical protein